LSAPRQPRRIWIALLVMAPCLFAHGDEKNCKEVSGGVVTNVLNENGNVNLPGESKNFVATALSTATGTGNPFQERKYFPKSHPLFSPVGMFWSAFSVAVL
jgi:hypothetical protein